MKSLNKLTRSLNRINAKVKDVEAVGSVFSGNPSKLVKRAKNKAKGKLMFKLFKWLG